MDWSQVRKFFRRGKLATNVILFPANVVQAYLVVCAVWSWLLTWWATYDATHQWTRLEELKLFFAVAVVSTIIALPVAWFLPLIRHRWTSAQPAPNPKLAVVSPPPVAPPPKRSLTGYEIEQKLRKIDELLDFVRDNTARIEVDGNQLRLNPWGAMKMGLPAFLERCTDYRNDVTSLTNGMQNIRHANAHHADVISVLPPQNDMGEFANAIINFGRTIERLSKFSELSEADFNFLLEPRDLELRERIIRYAQWRNAATTRLLQMRGTLAAA